MRRRDGDGRCRAGRDGAVAAGVEIDCRGAEAWQALDLPHRALPDGLVSEAVYHVAGLLPPPGDEQCYQRLHLFDGAVAAPLSLQQPVVGASLVGWEVSCILELNRQIRFQAFPRYLRIAASRLIAMDRGVTTFRIGVFSPGAMMVKRPPRFLRLSEVFVVLCSTIVLLLQELDRSAYDRTLSH